MILIIDEEGELWDDGLTEERCPDCGKRKRWHRGKGDSRFMGCSGYPKCRWTSYRAQQPSAENMAKTTEAC